MTNEMTIEDETLATNLIALGIFCAKNGTDNCDIELTTSKGKINCHIEFSEVDNGNDYFYQEEETQR